jgi:hypothetical protein
MSGDIAPIELRHQNLVDVPVNRIGDVTGVDELALLRFSKSSYLAMIKPAFLEIALAD